MALVLGVGLMVPPSLAAPQVAEAASKSVTVEKTENTNDWCGNDKLTGNDWTVDGNQAFCLNPGMSGPNEGTYTERTLKESDCSSAKYYRALIGAIYYSMGGPGKSKGKSLMPSKDYKNNNLTSTSVIKSNQHAYMAYLFNGGSWNATFTAGKDGDDPTLPDADYKTWFNANMKPGSGSDWTEADTWGAKVNALTNDKDMIANGGYSFEDFAEKVMLVPGKTTTDSSGQKWHSQSLITWTFEEPTMGDLEVTKASANTSITAGNPLYSLEGAVFELKDGSKVVATATVEGGKAQFTDIEAGTYTLHEKTAPRGYKAAADKRVTITAGHTNADTETVNDPPLSDPANIQVRKYDQVSGKYERQGDATLEGAQFTYRYYAGYYDAGSLPAEPTRTWVLKTNDRGQAPLVAGDDLKVSGDAFYRDEDGNIRVPLGTLSVTETAAPTGYLLGYYDDNGDFQAPMTYVTQFRQDGESVERVAMNYTAQMDNVGGATFNAKVDELVARGGVRISKKDREYDDFTEQGAATLAGAEFEIVNESEAGVTVDGNDYGVGEVVKTIATEYDPDSGAYIAQTAADALPYGTYLIHESKASRGYLLDDAAARWSKTFEVRNDGDVADFTDVADACDDPVIRGDYAMYKIRSTTQKPMANIPFSITSKTTGETHVAVTDGNGYLNTASEWIDHTKKTNANDAALDSAGNVDEDALDADSGIWFSGTPAGAVSPDDARGALPYDTYTVQELPVSGNEGANLITRDFTITKDSYTLPPGTVENKFVSIGTELRSAEGAKLVSGDGETELVDTVSYVNLDAGEEYTLKGELHKFGEGGVDLGVIAKKSVTFTAHEVPVDVEVPFAVQPEDLDGDKVVAYERLYNPSATLAASHEDPDDASQTVMIPRIGTELLTDSGGKVAPSASAAILVDTVAYRNLIPGRMYTLKGTLHARGASGEDAGVVGDGHGGEATASASFIPEAESGTETVEFTLPAGSAAGAVVAYEELWFAGEMIASHEEISDESQTVYRPGITTVATDTETGTHTGSAYGSVTDQVAYTGLTAGETYTITSTLHLKGDDGEDAGVALGASGSEITESTTFTAEATSGTVDITFAEQPDGKAGRTYVAFETLAGEEGGLLASEEEIGNADQSVSYPEIATSAHGKDTESHAIEETAEAAVVDTVTYRNVPAGSYTVTGTLHAIGQDGSDLGVFSRTKGDPVTSSLPLELAEASSGSVDLEFAFDSSYMRGKKFVAFEVMTDNETGAVVAAHEDASDEDQAVSVAGITTEATDSASGAHEAEAATSPTITDKVAFTGLVAGEHYNLVGKVVNQSTGQEVALDDGSKTVTKGVKATSPDGTEEMMFILSTQEATDGNTYTVIEELYDESGNRVVAEHNDTRSADQSVTYRKEAEPKTFDKTGSPLPPAARYAFIAAMVAAAAALLARWRRNNRRYWPVDDGSRGA